MTKSTSSQPLYAENFQWVDPYWPCGKALIESEEQVLVPDYFTSDVATPVHIGIHYTTVSRAIQSTLNPTTTKLMANTTLVDRQRITVKETCLTGVCFLREHNLKPSENCLVLDLLQQTPERDVLEVLVRLLAQVHARFPTVILANDNRANAVLEAMSDDELANVVEVVLQPEVPFLALPFGVVLVELLVDALANATVDQYGSRCLVCGYRTKVIQPDVHARHAFCLALGLCWLFVLHIHDEPEPLRCDDHLLVLPLAIDTEAVVGGRNGFRLLLDLVLPSLDGFVVEDDLSQFVFVVRRFGSLHELRGILVVGVECLPEIRPIGQALAYCLLRRLGIV